MTIKEDEIRILKIKSFAEAQAFLDEKKKVFGEESAAMPILLDENRNSEELEKFQGDLHKDERVMLMLREALSRFENSDELSCAKKDCERIISETRIFEERIDKKRREKMANEEKKEFNLLSFFSLSLLFPSAAKSLTEFFFPGNHKAAKIATIVTAAIGISYHFRKDISIAWKKAAEKISEKDTAFGLYVYGLGTEVAQKAVETRKLFVNDLATKTKHFSVMVVNVKKKVVRKPEKKNDLT